MAIAAGLSGAGAAAAASPQTANDWCETGGPATARAIADACLQHSRDGDDRIRCIRAPDAQCRAEHGNQTTIDLTECIRIVRSAWTAKLSDAAARIERRAPPAIAAGFKASQAAWSRWYIEDCRIQAEWSKGGTLNGLESGWCELDQIGLRAITLGALADTFDQYFP
jgi:hypothetical protein